MRATIALLGLACAAGCLRQATYACTGDTQCLRGGVQGICEPIGYCSFEDPDCPSGRRYGELSGDHRNECVGGNPGTDGGTDTTTIDGRSIDAPPGPFCDANDATLVGCWQFENDLADASGDGNTGTGTNITYAAGKVGMAAVSGTTSHIAVLDSASLTPTAITIEGWINPSTLPATGRMGIFDNDGQYGMFITTTGLQCINVSATVTLSTNQWTHVACTYDGTGRLYVNGFELAMVGGGGALGAGNTNGSAIAGNSPTGDSLDGMIDQLRIWSVARTAAQVCAAAGGLGCP